MLEQNHVTDVHSDSGWYHCHQCGITYFIPVYRVHVIITTLNEDSVVTSQVSPPGCHPAVCNKRQTTTTAIAAMKNETCDDDTNETPSRPVTISAGEKHTVRINYDDNNILFQPHTFMCCLSHAKRPRHMLIFFGWLIIRFLIDAWSHFSIADGGDPDRGNRGLGQWWFKDDFPIQE